MSVLGIAEGTQKGPEDRGVAVAPALVVAHVEFYNMNQQICASSGYNSGLFLLLFPEEAAFRCDIQVSK